MCLYSSSLIFLYFQQSPITIFIYRQLCSLWQQNTDSYSIGELHLLYSTLPPVSPSCTFKNMIEITCIPPLYRTLEIHSPEEIDEQTKQDMSTGDLIANSSAAANIVHSKPQRPGRGKGTRTVTKFSADSSP
jgi:hypothetical protein